METLKVFTPLGIRFWDSALEVPVSDGLVVAAWVQGGAHPPVHARRTPSGVYAFQGLPGLHDVEYPAAEGLGVASPPRSLGFVITVEDTLRRLLAAVFSVELPLSHRGIFLATDPGSPPGSGGRAYLFPAPTRAVAPGMAAIRADLWDREADRPAAHAAVSVQVNGRTWPAVADGQGRTLVLFPYPVVERLRLGSPPGSGQGAIKSHRWPVSIRARYRPEGLRYPLEGTPGATWPWPVTPSLKSILREQPSALIWPSQAGPPVEEWIRDLTYGEELVLHTRPKEQTSSRLLISRGTSPP